MPVLAVGRCFSRLFLLLMLDLLPSVLCLPMRVFICLMLFRRMCTYGDGISSWENAQSLMVLLVCVVVLFLSSVF